MQHYRSLFHRDWMCGYKVFSPEKRTIGNYPSLVNDDNAGPLEAFDVAGDHCVPMNERGRPKDRPRCADRGIANGRSVSRRHYRRKNSAKFRPDMAVQPGPQPGPCRRRSAAHQRYQAPVQAWSPKWKDAESSAVFLVWRLRRLRSEMHEHCTMVERPVLLSGRASGSGAWRRITDLHPEALPISLWQWSGCRDCFRHPFTRSQLSQTHQICGRLGGLGCRTVLDATVGPWQKIATSLRWLRRHHPARRR
jgi:hypothetical protein